MSGSIPEGWAAIKIEDIADVKGGKRLPTGESFSDCVTEHPYLRVTDFYSATIDMSGLKYLKVDTHQQIANYIISKEDLYISIAGTIGLVGSIPSSLDGANLTENAAKICNLSGIDQAYLKHFLNSQSAKEQFKDKTTSSGQPKLALFRIRDCDLLLPPRVEQKIIADKLDELLAQVERTKIRLDTIPAILKIFRQSVLAAAVSGNLTAEWRTIHPDIVVDGSTNIINTKQGVLDSDELDFSVPESWIALKFGTQVKFINGDRGKKYPNRNEYVDSGLPFINTGHIEPDGSLSLERMNYITRDKFNSLGGGKIESGDLVYCLRGATMGKTAKVEMFSEGAIASSLVIIRPNKELLTSFAYQFLISPQGKDLITRFDNGSAQPNLSAKSVSIFPFALPPLKEQTEIVRRVEELFTYADKVEAQVNNAQERVNNLSQSLLAKAFSGELTAKWREQNPDLITGENSAKALLGKIKVVRTALTAKNKPIASKRKTKR
jgi:type I restriction enzyme S subunit